MARCQQGKSSTFFSTGFLSETFLIGPCSWNMPEKCWLNRTYIVNFFFFCDKTSSSKSISSPPYHHHHNHPQCFQRWASVHPVLLIIASRHIVVYFRIFNVSTIIAILFFFQYSLSSLSLGLIGRSLREWKRRRTKKGLEGHQGKRVMKTPSN